MENNEKELEERELKELELMNENENREFYVYVHIRKDNNTVFYVGKGTGDRAYYPYRNLHHDNICDACGYEVVKIKENLTESQAYRLENKMIKYYVHTLGYGIDIEGYDDYNHALPHLTNRDWGGIGGKKGIKRSEEEKRNISEKMKGKNPYANKTPEEMEEIRKKLSESHKGIKMSEETKRKSSESHKGKLVGEKNGMWGKIPWNKGKEASEESRQKMSESHKGKKHSEEAKRKMSENNCRRHKVVCITTGKIFDCIKDAEKYYSCGGISQCCKGKRKSAGKLSGWIELQWKYLEDYNNEFKGILINPIIK